jgi:hypothetical protein
MIRQLDRWQAILKPTASSKPQRHSGRPRKHRRTEDAFRLVSLSTSQLQSSTSFRTEPFSPSDIAFIESLSSGQYRSSQINTLSFEQRRQRTRGRQSNNPPSTNQHNELSSHLCRIRPTSETRHPRSENEQVLQTWLKINLSRSQPSTS